MTGMDDSAIEHAVLAALEADERLSSQPVEVRVSNGLVTLSGRVQSYRRKLAAQELAVAVTDSAHVDNRLEVSPPGNSADEDVAEDVRAHIEEHESLVKAAIVVEVRAGRVTLSGTVASDSERTLAQDAALHAPGVQQVANQLVVDPAARTESIVVGKELEHALASEPGLEGSELRVAVSGSVAVLSGTARSRGQVDVALALVRQAWIGELRDEVVIVE